MIDETDRKILEILQKNARMTNAEIARQIEMAPSAVLERMRKMESRGVIQGYQARIDPGAVGLGLVAFILVRTNSLDGGEKIGMQLAAIPEVQEVHLVAGEDCYLVKVRTVGTDSLGDLLREKFGRMKSISTTRSTIVLKTLKDTIELPVNLTSNEA